MRLRNVHSIAASTDSVGIYQGVYRNTPVVVKRIRTQGSGDEAQSERLEDFQREVSLAKFFSDLGRGPKFLGITEIRNKDFGIVFEKVPDSWFVGLPNEPGNGVAMARLYAEASIRKLWVKEIQEIGELLDANYLYTPNPQFLLTPQGQVYLIDFGNYRRNIFDSLPKSVQPHIDEIIAQFR